MSKHDQKPTPEYPMTITDAIAALLTVNHEPKKPKPARDSKADPPYSK